MVGPNAGPPAPPTLWRPPLPGSTFAERGLSGSRCAAARKCDPERFGPYRDNLAAL